LLSAIKIEGSTVRCYLLFFVEIRRKGFEQGGSEAEENASGKHFRRRGNERSEAIARQRGTKSLALRHSIRVFKRLKTLVFFLLKYSIFALSPTGGFTYLWEFGVRWR